MDRKAFTPLDRRKLLKRHCHYLTGFTLLELLVVIVIIGIILALSFPVMGRAREGVRRALCANNLRQHGIAWYLYLDDHDERFPKFVSFSNSVSDIGCNPETFGGKSAPRLTTLPHW